MNSIAPGTRIRVRDEEWLVRRIDLTSSGSRIFGVVGLTPFVSGKEARFIEDIEREMGEITIVDPRNTRAIRDDSPYYRKTRLILESHIRASTPTDSRIYLGHRGAIDPISFQLEPAQLALEQPRQRILIADAVGLGKTIECGVLLTELIKRGRGQRILVVAVKSMLTQFQKELWSRFSIPLVRLDSIGLQRVRTRIPTNHNPFHYYDKSIISIDTLKQDNEFRKHLENAWWDVIVIDEAHNVAERGAARGGGNSQRSRAAKLLSNRSDSLLLLSATPHDGKRESFASLMNMLNPTAIKNPKDYGPADIDGLFIRRFKKDVKHQLASHFPNRVVSIHKTEATPPEEAAYEALAEMQFASIDSRRSGARVLFRTLLEKSLFSSPIACISTIQERIKRLEKRESSSEIRTDIANLRELQGILDAITPLSFSKYQHLLALLSPKSPDSIGWDRKNPSDRLVLFTERIDTLHFLDNQLRADLKLKDKEVRILHGGLSDIEQQEIVEAFGSKDSNVRLLIASDVASEGINLHHQSHRMIHFDIPWSLLTFQQRNGRIDRYGQTEEPQIHYLQTLSAHPRIRGDQRILELLIEKDHEVQQNIGDPSEFTGLFTVEEEEEAVAEAIQSERSGEAAIQEVFSQRTAEDEWFASLLSGIAGSPADPAEDETPSPQAINPTVDLTASEPSFYSNDFEWAKEGFETLARDLSFRLECDPISQQIDFSLPEGLLRVLERQPDEIHPKHNDNASMWSLCADPGVVIEEIRQCRTEENRWPRKHLLWEQHPAMQWMKDRLLNSFGLHDASCIHLSHLRPGERIVMANGVIPNRKGHPLIQRWYGLQFLNGSFQQELTLEQLIAHTRFHEDHPNSDTTAYDFRSVEALFKEAVEMMTVIMSEARDRFRADNAPKLQEQLQKLSQFLGVRTTQLEMEYHTDSAGPQHFIRQSAKERKLREIQKAHDDYKEWITDTMETEDAPSIRIFATFGNFDA